MSFETRSFDLITTLGVDIQPPVGTLSLQRRIDAKDSKCPAFPSHEGWYQR